MPIVRGERDPHERLEVRDVLTPLVLIRPRARGHLVINPARQELLRGFPAFTGGGHGNDRIAAEAHPVFLPAEAEFESPFLRPGGHPFEK